MPEGVLGVKKRGTNDISYFLSISSSHIINIYNNYIIYLLSAVHFEHRW